jgi:ATP adenylyltransferase
MHTHIVPRWEGDTNFMPILSDTKIVVEGMLETYLKLHDAFVQQNGTEDRGEEKSVWVGE